MPIGLRNGVGTRPVADIEMVLLMKSGVNDATSLENIFGLLLL